MKKRRLISAVMAAALTLSLAQPLAAGAANSSFSDISDQNTAVNADILRLMGVVSGTGSNQFDPSGGLTRAQFSTMVVNFMQKGDQVPIHTTRTIFSDVTGTHWARGYVNLAASLTVKDGEEELALISGVGNGQFRPDDPITLAQAATILIRVLGYTSAQAGAVWPQSYMNLAASIGLSDGLAADYNAPLTRAQAAQLFVNALRCKNAQGAVYYTTLGEVSEDTIVLAVNVQTDDGSTGGAIRTTRSESSESYLPANGQGDVYALQGKRGAQVLNDKGEIVTFVPDDSNAITVILSGNAEPSYIKGNNGNQYTMAKDTMLYTSDAAEGKPYMEGYSALVSGTQVTMYSERGKIVAVYAIGSSTSTSDGAVIVMGNPTVAMFHQLTGGATNFNILKNREPIRMSQIQPYDVVTYDQLNNTLIVSDLRLTCVYEDASPNAKAPTEMEILGNTFEVLDSAWTTTQNFNVGDNITLLLTVDGKVAGVIEPNGKTRSTAIGIVSGDGATVFLPNGGTLALKGTVSSTAGSAEQLVNISSGTKGRIGASPVTSKQAPGDFDIENMKLGEYTVTAGVRIYEKVGSSVAGLNIANLDVSKLEASDIDTYHLNSSDMVDYIVLKAVTGDAYTYGLLREGEQQLPSVGTLPGGSNRTVTVENGTGGLSETVIGYNFENRSFGGVARGFGEIEGLPKAAAVVELIEFKNISPRDFFVSQGANYVNLGGKTYRVSDHVECYKEAIKEWFEEESGQARLSACLAFSSDLTVYIDPVGEKVRVIVAH